MIAANTITADALQKKAAAVGGVVGVAGRRCRSALPVGVVGQVRERVGQAAGQRSSWQHMGA